jgi:regulator of sigma E protease
MNDILLYTGLLLLSLGILVFWHELGHYLPAKWFGMRVEKFYLFFDWPRKLFSKTIGETEYGIGLLPLGGYVKISGIIDENMDKAHMDQPVQPYEFRAKPVWQKLIVMTGGVIMNVILGIVIFSLIKYTQGEQRLPLSELKYGLSVPDSSIAKELGFQSGDKILTLSGTPVKYFEDIANPGVLLNEQLYFDVVRGEEKLKIEIPGDLIERFADKKGKAGLLFYPNQESFVVTDSSFPAFKAGIRNGDRVLAIDSQPVYLFDEVRTAIKARKGAPSLALTVLRNQDTLQLSVPPDTSGLIGIAPQDRFRHDTIAYSLVGAFVPGSVTAFTIIFDTFKGFKKIFRGEVSASNSVAGPVRIAGMIGVNFKRDGWLGFWMLTGMLSMALAFMNILPIPALDGGHVIFLLIEGITGREPSLKVRMIAQQVGMVILLSLMAFVLFNDIFSTLFG